MGTLAFGCILPATGRLRDFHPLETCAARRTTKKMGCKNGYRFYTPSFFAIYISSSSSIQIRTAASDGIRRSPRGLTATEPTFGPSGRQLRLNCCEKNLQ